MKSTRKIKPPEKAIYLTQLYLNYSMMAQWYGKKTFRELINSEVISEKSTHSETIRLLNYFFKSRWPTAIYKVAIYCK